MPRDLDPISRWLFKPDSLQNAKKSATAKNALKSQLLLPLNQKLSAGQIELIYRGLNGRSGFKIDLIVPQLDPQVAYPYQFNIKAAKKSFRLSNRDYKLIYAKKGALLLKQIDKTDRF